MNKNYWNFLLREDDQLCLIPPFALLPAAMNPDGFSVSKEGCGGSSFLAGLARFGATGRENANRVDLNRDFPKQFDDPKNLNLRQLEQGRQPETM